MSKQKKQLILNVTLAIFTLFTLVISVVAWFSTRQAAEINSLDLAVNRKEMKLEAVPTLIELPCATKIADRNITSSFFNSDCIDVKEYTILGEGSVCVDVKSDDAGLLGYVCDSSVAQTNYYEELIQKLQAELFDDDTWTFEDIRDALKNINRRPVGDIVDGNTKIKIIFWAEYDEVEKSLNEMNQSLNGDAYLNLEYTADITFTG